MDSIVYIGLPKVYTLGKLPVSKRKPTYPAWSGKMASSQWNQMKSINADIEIFIGIIKSGKWTVKEMDYMQPTLY